MSAPFDESSVDEIEYTYNPAVFDAVTPDPAFVNAGEANWQRLRAHWNRASDPTQQDPVDEDNIHRVDVEHVMVCLHQYKPFPAHVPLTSMIEILSVLWEEEGF